MNNPVRTERGCHTLRHKLSFTTYDRGRASVATTVSIRPRIQKTDRTKHEALPHPWQRNLSPLYIRKQERSNASRVKCKSEGGWLRMRCSKICDHVFTDGLLANQPRAAAAFPYIRKLITVDIVAKCPERGCTVLTTEVLQCCGSYLSTSSRATRFAHPSSFLRFSLTSTIMSSMSILTIWSIFNVTARDVHPSSEQPLLRCCGHQNFVRI